MNGNRKSDSQPNQGLFEQLHLQVQQSDSLSKNFQDTIRTKTEKLEIAKKNIHAVFKTGIGISILFIVLGMSARMYKKKYQNKKMKRQNQLSLHSTNSTNNQSIKEIEKWL